MHRLVGGQGSCQGKCTVLHGGQAEVGNASRLNPRARSDTSTLTRRGLEPIDVEALTAASGLSTNQTRSQEPSQRWFVALAKMSAARTLTKHSRLPRNHASARRSAHRWRMGWIAGSERPAAATIRNDARHSDVGTPTGVRLLKNIVGPALHREVKASQANVRENIEKAKDLAAEADRRIKESREIAEQGLIVPPRLSVGRRSSR
jgi:hypothetical protein